jgi:hypothetical protein
MNNHTYTIKLLPLYNSTAYGYGWISIIFNGEHPKTTWLICISIDLVVATLWKLVINVDKPVRITRELLLLPRQRSSRFTNLTIFMKHSLDWDTHRSGTRNVNSEHWLPSSDWIQIVNNIHGTYAGHRLTRSGKGNATSEHCLSPSEWIQIVNNINETYAALRQT